MTARPFKTPAFTGRLTAGDSDGEGNGLGRVFDGNAINFELINEVVNEKSGGGDGLIVDLDWINS